ncbi:Crp/Fnr family transcriptional regulator [Collinsella vaginalis]|uniref:Crp/Fnr family transcriptional regulator n=1 Tax=Collinsella vaginalis TaxID=1870987 RepID=UPI000A2690E1|nr:Crp/Fnr family transcriptional regulator [Collinsella vaginalis]
MALNYDEIANQVAGTAPFEGIDHDDTVSMLRCMGARVRAFKSEELILRMGEPAPAFGLVLDGGVRIERTDAWGDTSVIGFARPGEVFGESYACAPNTPLLVNAVATEGTRILLLNVNHVLRPCDKGCAYHARLLTNLLMLSARKNIELSRRIFHTSPKSIRGKLLSYLSSEAARAGSRRFSIPFNRQQLADYLAVDRCALSSELGRMQRDGLLRTRRSEFELLVEAAEG